MFGRRTGNRRYILFHSHSTISCDNLDEAIERYTNDLGYRLDMIKPADAPREALVSKGGQAIRLLSVQKPAREQGRNPDATGCYALAHSQTSAFFFNPRGDA